MRSAMGTCAPWVIFHCSRVESGTGIRYAVGSVPVRTCKIAGCSVCTYIAAAREDVMEAEFGKYLEERFPKIPPIRGRAASSALKRLSYIHDPYCSCNYVITLISSAHACPGPAPRTLPLIFVRACRK